jgi:hypothetical protein
MRTRVNRTRFPCDIASSIPDVCFIAKLIGRWPKIQVKLSLYLIKYRAVPIYGRADIQLHTLLMSAPRHWGEWLGSRPGRFTCGERQGVTTQKAWIFRNTVVRPLNLASVLLVDSLVALPKDEHSPYKIPAIRDDSESIPAPCLSSQRIGFSSDPVVRHYNSRSNCNFLDWVLFLYCRTGKGNNLILGGVWVS